MKLYTLPKHKYQPRAFTLIELLVVITIIGILAAMAFPGASAVLGKARRAGAKNQALQVRSAISAYYTEYRRYPIQGGSAGGDQQVQTNNVLMDVLLGAQGNPLNPRGIAFFAGKQARGGGANAKGGLVMSGNGGGLLVDPWGMQFNVILDTNFDNRVLAPFSKSGNAGGNNIVPDSVIVWSLGPDAGVGGSGNPLVKDYITTW
ncbi:MAG: type II secretion system GspH family protein [Verrucomicrobiales bacterium]|nr:type II secretion system GspH family protein [Verrucomicrobiales bacterium]